MGNDTSSLLIIKIAEKNNEQKINYADNIIFVELKHLLN